MGGYAIVGLIAAIVTALTTPICRKLAFRYGVVAMPDADRRLHQKPTPQLGGVAMCAAVLVGLAVASVIPQFRGVFGSSSEPLGIALAAVIITAVGVVDDKLELSPPAKLAGMVLAGTALYFLGVVMYYVRVPFLGILVLSPDLVPLLTVLWVVGMANAINLIDGLDGLATGIVAISSGVFFLYSDRLFKAGLLPGDNIGPLIAVITCGACIGFLPWNFSPARIFMGDGGALLLGLLLAASTMVVGGRADPASRFGGQTYFFVAPLFIPFVILAVPMFDTFLAVLRRTWRRTGVAIADRQHLHHRLLELGHGPRRAVVILWSFTLIFSGLALAPAFISGRWPLIPLGLAFMLTLAVTLLHPDLRRRRRARRIETRFGHPAWSAAHAAQTAQGAQGAQAVGHEVGGASVAEGMVPAGPSPSPSPSPSHPHRRRDDVSGTAGVDLVGPARVVRPDEGVRGRDRRR